MTEQLAGKRLWEPSPERVEASGIKAFIDWVNAKHGCDLGNYEELWQWSVDDIGRFWESICQCYGIEFSSP